MIRTRRLFLKEIVETDFPVLLKLHSLPEVSRYKTLMVPDHTSLLEGILREAVEDKLRPVRKSFRWTVNNKADQQFIGEAGLDLTADRFRIGEIYYSLLPGSWGRGLATELAREIVRFGFRELGLHRIRAGVAEGNRGSARVLEKIGMIKEGTRRGVLPIRGQWIDCHLYAILEDEFMG